MFRGLADHLNVHVCWNSNKIDVESVSVNAVFALVVIRVSEVHLCDLFDVFYLWRKVSLCW